MNYNSPKYRTVIYTDWANHYLAKSGHQRLIKDLQQDIADGVLLADIIQIIANEKVEDINGCPGSQSQMIENVDVCLSFLAARGVNVQGLSAEEIRNGNLKAILGLFFSLSRYKQQQQQQQQYYQSLVELQQQVTQQSSGAVPSSQQKTQDMQSRLPGPSRVPAAGSSTSKVQGASNLNRRSQSFNSIDKNKSLQYASSTEKESVKGLPQPGGMNGNVQTPTSTGQQQASAIPSPSANKPWRSKSMNMKHTATSSMLSVKQPSPATSPPPASDRLKPPISEAAKASSTGQKSMLEKFKLINSRTASRPPLSPSSGPSGEGGGREDNVLSECGETDGLSSGLNSGGSTGSSSKQSTKVTTPPSKTGSKTLSNKKSLPQPKDKEDKSKSKGKAGTPSKEEKELPVEPAKKTSKIASLIPKGGKASAVKKENSLLASSGIPKPGLKVAAPTGKTVASPTSVGAKDTEKSRTGKGNQSLYVQKSPADGRTPGSLASAEGRRTSMVSSTSTSALSAAMVMACGQLGGYGIVQLPQQQQYNHPNTATVAPFMYRTYSENDCTAVGPADCCVSPTKADQYYNKTAKQCLEEISAQRMHKGTELSVFQVRNPAGRGKSNLRKQKSLTNLTRLSEGEHRVYSFDLEETESPRETSRNFLKKDGRQRAGSLSRTLSRSEHSLFHGSPPAGAAAAQRASEADLCAVSSGSGKWSTSLGCQWTEVKAPNKVCEVTDEEGSGSSSSSRSDDDPALFCGSNVTGSQYWADEEAGCQREGTAHLDQEVILTMLGDLEQALYTNILREDPETRRMRTVKNIADLRQNLEETMSSLRGTQISHRYLTDGGLNVYSRNMNRIPDLASSRDVIQRGVNEVMGDTDSWDDSSSVSSGLSDTLDNISTDDLNTASSVSSYSNIAASPRKSKGPQLKTDSEKHSVSNNENTWGSPEDLKKTDDELNSSMDSSNKWKGNSSGHYEDSEKGGQKTTLSVSQTGSWRRGMTAQVGITPPRTKTATGTLKTPGKTDDAKASEKGKVPSKSIQRSPSDAGKNSGDEGKKPPSGIARPPTTGSFGFKKTGSGALITASGATMTSGSATLGKIPKSSAISDKGNGGRKTSLDGSQNQDDGVLLVSSKNPLQYRSLPRPAKSSSSGIVARGGHRSSSSSIDSNVSSKSSAASSTKRREPTKMGSGRCSPVTINQTDKEKVSVSDSESVSLSSSPKSSPTSTSQTSLRQPGCKYPDIASPTFRRLFGTKASSKPSSTASPELKGSTVISNPHATLTWQGSLESPSSGTGSMGSAGGQSGGSSPLFSKPPDLTTDVISLNQSLASSPASVHSLTSGGKQWSTNLSSSSAGSKDTLSYQSLTSLHTSSESIDFPVGHHGSLSGLTTSPKEVHGLLMRTGSVKSTASEGYTPSSRQTSQEEGKEWLRSHSTGGLQDTGSQSPLASPSAISSSTAGKYHYSNLVSPTNLSQFNLPGPSMMRSNSIPAQESSFDLYGGSHVLGGSAVSLEEQPRGMSRSESFRDSMEEAPLVTKTSSSRLCECTEAEAEIILQLKNELREKELKLTDIRLEALSSAHHLDQIREAMNRMQNEIELLKAENDRLKLSGSPTPAAAKEKTGRPPSETSSTSSSSSSRQSLGLSLNNLNVTDTIMSDVLLDDGYEGTMCKEGRSVRIVVTIHRGSNSTKQDVKCQEYLIGSIGVSGKTKWDVLDGVIRRLFKEYIFRVDPLTTLGLNSDSIVSYRIGDIVRAHNVEIPELLPCGYLVGVNNVIAVNLKGVKENSIDSLVFDTLIPKTISQRYLNLLMEHRRIILSGPSGTGKTFLANKLAEYVVCKSGRENREGNIASFNVDHKSSKELRQYLSNLADQCNSEGNEADLPVVVILDNLHHIGSLSDIFNGFLNCKYHKCPYVIGTMNQAVSSSPNLELHHNFRWVLCANHTEPVKGFLGRYLRRKLIETEIDKNMRNNDLIKIIDWIPKTWQHLNTFLEAHSSSDVTIGPRLFLSCPMDADSCRVWFTDLWNYSLVPYLLEAVREGLQLYGKRAAWEDPSKWVIDTYPWSSASLQHDWQSLLQLRPEDVGYEGYTSAKEGGSSKQVSQSDTEGDPLLPLHFQPVSGILQDISRFMQADLLAGSNATINTFDERC
ncbi:Neuron navigator 3 [Acipenser ruthenus]|uniref:Neuron navigator 3 n=1 Tax=Acipenser ruthenus TaxID=7906 RepID=A0A444UP34_ACIRT|nr:Neuron navigator 3 [Acipenser ruthenus]